MCLEEEKVYFLIHAFMKPSKTHFEQRFCNITPVLLAASSSEQLAEVSSHFNLHFVEERFPVDLLTNFWGLSLFLSPTLNNI